MQHSFLQKIGANIRKCRESKNLSQEQLGLMCGFTGSYMGMIERAEYNFKILKLFEIAKALGVNIKDFFDFED